MDEFTSDQRKMIRTYEPTRSSTYSQLEVKFADLALSVVCGQASADDIYLLEKMLKERYFTVTSKVDNVAWMDLLKIIDEIERAKRKNENKI